MVKVRFYTLETHFVFNKWVNFKTNIQFLNLSSTAKWNLL